MSSAKRKAAKAARAQRAAQPAPAAPRDKAAQGKAAPTPPAAPAPKRVSPTRRTASIARSIARSIWLHRLVSFVVLDALLCLVLLGSFVFQCNQQLPEGSVTWGFFPDSSVEMGFQLPRGALAESTYEVTLADGEKRVFPITDAAGYAVPVCTLVLAWEFGNLVSGFFATPGIRRKLRPLNELALAAEAIGNAAASEPAVAKPAAPEKQGADPKAAKAAERANTNKIKSLEQAIALASVESPQVTTGDADLRSIEVALNGLLRRMQEAKLQQMRFVSDASHELRTPIAVIQGYVNMLDRWGKTDESVLDESIEALKSESAHMKELVEQLLFLARGDSGRTTLHRTTFNLAAMVGDVWEESAMIDPGHSYRLLAPEDAGEDPSFAMVGDVALVKQSMRVIVQNAAKYSPAGSTIALGVERDAASNAVAYTVKDEGVGMSREDSAHAFERFWRSDEARNGDTGGTGLGLSIAKWIVDAHEGRIEVLSVEDVGTRFCVWFGRGI